MSNATHVVRATPDDDSAGARLAAAPITLMASSERPRPRHDCDQDGWSFARDCRQCVDEHERAIDARSNDGRAAVQRRIADAIRTVPPEVADEAARVILSRGIHRVVLESSDERIARNAALVLAALAACAKHPAILDAVRQVAQVHALEIREDNPTEGG
jgi:hypothetical protein